jgi:hypothetical protein
MYGMANMKSTISPRCAFTGIGLYLVRYKQAFIPDRTNQELRLTMSVEKARSLDAG